MKKYWIIFFTTLSITSSTILLVRHHNNKASVAQNDVALDTFLPESPATFQLQKTGKQKKKGLTNIYTKVAIDSLKLPNVNSKFLTALEHQMTLLKKADDKKVGDLEIEVDKMAQVVEIFRTSKSTEQLTAALDAYQIQGDDGKGSVRFTGYYSPVISARRKADAVYKFPVYLVKNRSDEMTLAYVRDRGDIRSMCIEGVAYLQFPDGEKRLVAFDGDYRKVYETEEKNENTDNPDEPKKILAKYTSVMTTRTESKPMGASKVPLTNDITVAVDNSYIPLGSVLLAEVPIVDEKGNLVRTEFRFVLAQDTGSQIQGTGHIDLYMGEGDAAKERIKNMNKFGRIWLLLPKEKPKTLAQNL